MVRRQGEKWASSACSSVAFRSDGQSGAGIEVTPILHRSLDDVDDDGDLAEHRRRTDRLKALVAIGSQIGG